MSIDDKILELHKVVKQKKHELELSEKAQKQTWVTNCSFKLLSANSTNITTASEGQIVRMTTELLTVKNNLEDANKLLGTNQELKIDGYTFDEWLQDFKKRIATIQFNSKKAELNLLESRLDAIVSPEQRRLMELEEITKSLGV